jgi:uncharacterized RDD family membrane protein YckC
MNELNESNKIETEPNIGKRILAGLIDYSIVSVFFYFFIYTFGEPDEVGELSVNGLPALIPIIFWLFITVGIEQSFGATLGNLLVKLQPVSIRKFQKEVTFSQSLKRHLLDPIDMFFFGIVGILLIKKTEQNQRLGDLWANTVVIKKSEKSIKTYGNIK